MASVEMDCISQDILEADAPENIMEVSDIGNLNANVVVNGSMLPIEAHAVQEKLVQRLGNLGINAKRVRLPLKSDADYEVNARDTFELLGLVVSTACAADVLRKFRMGSRVVHPDKTSHLVAPVASWANDMMQLLSQAKDEALWRLERIAQASHDSNMFVMPDFMEFSEQFQQSIIQTFKPNLAVLNSSDMRYATVTGPSGLTMLSSGQGRAFYTRLFDFECPAKESLRNLLVEARQGAPLDGLTCVLAFVKVPSEFPSWFQHELVALRSEGLSVHIVVLLLAPPLPCGWDQARASAIELGTAHF